MDARIRDGQRLVAAIFLIAALTEGGAFAQPTIYRCTVNDTVVFADRPCGENAQQYDISAERVSSYTPVEVKASSTSRSSATAVRTVKATAHESIAAAQARQAETCTRIQRSLDDIRSTMRAGYRAKQGERLRERQQKLSEQRRALRC